MQRHGQERDDGSRVIDALAGIELAVAGDAVLDVWLAGPARRLSREAPVPVVDVTDRELAAGGAGNTAANAAALGARARLVTVVGDDDDGRTLREVLRAAGVATDAVVTTPARRTAAKRRLLAGEHMLARFDESDPAPLDARTRAELARRASGAAGEADAVLVGDYGLGTLTDPVRVALAEAARRRRVPLVVDAHDLSRWRRLAPTAVTPSWSELLAALGVREVLVPAGERVEFLERHAADAHQRTGAALVAVTLDSDGAALLAGGRVARHVPTRPARQANTNGAGDTFAAAFTLALAAGIEPAEALGVAGAASAVVVRRPGTSVCDAEQLRLELAPQARGVLDPPALAAAVRAYRQAGKSIVFTNGCFDVLHAGHVAYLEQAKRLGDVLVVAVNSDASARRLKGPHRPVNQVDDRVAVLAGLDSVDHVVVFDEDSPTGLLELVRPDLYVKGGDYTPDMVPEAPLVRRLGGQVRTLGYLDDRSTTGLIQRIRGLDPAAS